MVIGRWGGTPLAATRLKCRWAAGASCAPCAGAQCRIGSSGHQSFRCPQLARDVRLGARSSSHGGPGGKHTLVLGRGARGAWRVGEAIVGVSESALSKGTPPVGPWRCVCVSACDIPGALHSRSSVRVRVKSVSCRIEG
eukprot:scaffold47_cov112-Isochrysis_galbana.AAC.12